MASPPRSAAVSAGSPEGGPFLPMFPEEVAARGLGGIDVLLVTGDAYVDHPAFGAAVIGRVLEAQGLKVGICAQPDWRSPTDLLRLGRPRLFVGITAGAMDSMVNHYTAHKRRRSDDAYTPGGAAGRRPDRAAVVYARLARRAFGPSTPIVLGGIEASLRRLAHYDYWEEKVLPSILVPSGADLLVYGQGEKPIVEIARRLAMGEDVCGLVDVPGTAVVVADRALAAFEGRGRGVVELPSFEEVARDKGRYAAFARTWRLEQLGARPKVLVQPHGTGEEARLVVVNEPMAPPTTEELDRIAELPYVREAHPSYGAAHIAALEQIRWSIQIVRGCAAGCSFCCIAEHQGKELSSRSEASILREVQGFAAQPKFRGTVTDLGGPTANMWRMGCTDASARERCHRPSCLHPSVCRHFGHDHGPLVELYAKAKAVKGVKHLFVGSGVRYDLAQDDSKNGERYVEALVTSHVSGQLKVAPEHVSEPVLAAMRKPKLETFERFRKDFARLSQKAGKEQYLVPYFVSSHPGSTLEEAVRLMEYLQANRWKPQQVQDFMPTPMTLAADMHWTGVDPFTGKPVAVVADMEEKRMQKALVRWGDPANRPLVEKALRLTGRLKPGERAAGVKVAGDGARPPWARRGLRKGSRGKR